MAKMPGNTIVTTTMMDEAASRGICGADWRASWWWRKPALAAEVYGTLGIAPDLMRGDVAGGGVVWLYGGVDGCNIYSVCSDAAADDAEALTAREARERAQCVPAAWYGWQEARRLVSRAAGGAPAIRVGSWVGGAGGERATLGMAVTLNARGDAPTQLQAGETVTRAPEGMRWFMWGGEARQKAAAKLANEGRVWFGNYLAMRNVVTHRARLILKEGAAEQDPRYPLKTSWDRRGKPKDEKTLSDLSELA